jgi:rhomboid protease GluP
MVLSIGIFFFMPNAKDDLSYSGQNLMKGEVWRILTFNFVHLNISHLIGNIIAFIITTLLAFEVGLHSEYFMGLFFVSSMTIALVEGLFLPTLIIAGASLGIYSILGGISISGKNLIPVYIFIPLIILSIFLTGIFAGTNQNTLIESFFHFFGFMFGLILYYGIIKYLNKKKNYLEVVE